MTDVGPDDVLAGGSYDLLVRRLSEQTNELSSSVAAVDAIRVDAFGSIELSLVGSGRLATELACTPRDIARVGDLLVFGYNTSLELGAITPEHVFTLYVAEPGDAHPALHALGADDPRNFLLDPAFRADFDKLYRFYNKARFADLRVTATQMLAVFVVGATEYDVQALRWAIAPDGSISYVDARGERDYTFPQSHEVTWTTSAREDQRAGAYPTVSVLDEVFVGFRNGRLQLRVDTGLGETSAAIDEQVQNPTQSLTDITVRHSATGDMLLITVELYNEAARTYVFSRASRTGKRVDAAGKSSRILPGNEGILFCGGYHMAATGTRTFDVDVADMVLEESISSPNGEDVLYVYRRARDGAYLLMPYNMVRRAVDQVIPANGFAIFDDGAMVLFRRSPHDIDASITHPIQWWMTPFGTRSGAVGSDPRDLWAAKVGNPALVAGIGAVYDLCRMVAAVNPARRTWENASAAARRIFDTNLWLADPETDGLRDRLKAVAATVGELIDEYATRERDRALARARLTQTEQLVRDVVSRVGSSSTATSIVATTGELRRARATVAATGEVAHVDSGAVQALAAQLDAAASTLSERASKVLDDAAAFAPFAAAIDADSASIATASTAAELDQLAQRLETQAADLEAVADTVSALDGGDPTVRTRIVRAVSEVAGALNRARAALQTRRRALASAEAGAAFDAELSLLDQTMNGSVAAADSPDQCDSVLARILVSIERIDSRYGDDPERSARLEELRVTAHEAINTRRNALVDEQNRRAGRITEAGERLCATIVKRAAAHTTDAEIEAFFASDQMCGRVRELADELDRLGDRGRAAELRSTLVVAAEQARRSLRDNLALGGDEHVVTLGGHQLARNLQPFEVVLSVRGDRSIEVTVTGTDYAHDVTQQLAPFSDLLELSSPSENASVSRAEYLAWATIVAAEISDGVAALVADAAVPAAIADRVARVAESRHGDGYQRGVHDADAARILAAVAAQLAGEPLLRYTGVARGLGRLWWSQVAPETRQQVTARVVAAASVRASVSADGPALRTIAEIVDSIRAFVALNPDPFADDVIQQSGSYLFAELASAGSFIVPESTAELQRQLLGSMPPDQSSALMTGIAAQPDPIQRFTFARDLVAGFVERDQQRSHFRQDIDDVAATLAHHGGDIAARPSTGALTVKVTGLVSDHRRIVEGSLETRIDSLAGLAGSHYQQMSVRWPDYLAARTRVVADAAAALRLDEHRPRVMAGFVRNALIDQALLPVVGANLARQLGTAKATNSARQGLLVVVSPPGYGKTTLMEWIADRLGLMIVKVNGPALGQDTVSLDPADAPNATARAEVEKINLAFRFGRNVMLYLDDIQHTSPVLLSRFIPLADATRRIEGVIDGQARTFDLRGKHFCVVMAGNPYTTGGGRFEIPDMLVNRSDVFNLGDVSATYSDAFAASYLENSVTACPTLAPHAARLLDDIAGVTAMSAGRIPVDSSQLTHRWDGADLDQAVKTVRHLARARDALLAVNTAYIESASSSDMDRSTPEFLLQGSYRNMARIASRVVPVMTPDELDRVVDDHYTAEAQTLTDKAEVNLLAYRRLVSRSTDADARRWDELVAAHRARQAAADPAAAIVAALEKLTAAVRTSPPTTG
jgi:ATPase involved in DNA repair/ATPase family associated with various cellular activities (AAA)